MTSGFQSLAAVNRCRTRHSMRNRRKTGSSREKCLPPTRERSALFKRVKQKATAPEVVVQQLLTRLGHAYSKNVRGIPGSPDIVSRDRLRAVFVHGCFWHRHPSCRASSTPKRNARFWLEKFAQNVRRDRRKVRELRSRGYSVAVVWECQTKTDAKRNVLERRLNRFFTTRP